MVPRKLNSIYQSCGPGPNINDNASLLLNTHHGQQRKQLLLSRFTELKKNTLPSFFLPRCILHTRTHTHTLTLCLSLSLSHSHTHTHTHTHTSLPLTTNFSLSFLSNSAVFVCYHHAFDLRSSSFL